MSGLRTSHRCERSNSLSHLPAQERAQETDMRQGSKDVPARHGRRKCFSKTGMPLAMNRAELIILVSLGLGSQ